MSKEEKEARSNFGRTIDQEAIDQEGTDSSDLRALRRPCYASLAPMHFIIGTFFFFFNF